MIPRDYQVAACAALWKHIHEKPTENPLVVCATGLGKSLMMGMFSWQLLTSYPRLRVLHLTHVKELIDGNYRALKAIWPQAPAGVYSAGLGRRDVHAPITYAGIMSVVGKPRIFGRVDVVVIDEAHRCSDNETASYATLLKELRVLNPNLIVVGFTATAFRATTGMLTDGKLFNTVCFDIGSGESFVWAVNQGYLIRPVPKHPGFQLDESNIKIVAGEYDNKQASAAFAEQNILERAVDTTIALGTQQGRRSWLTFCQSIEDAETVAAMYNAKGYPHEAVHSRRPDRDQVLADFKAGRLQGVVNRDVFTTGFDHPGIDLISMLRLTRSPGLWVQMIGRGTRPVFTPGYDINTTEGRLAAIEASYKHTTLVLDFCGNTERLGPINYPRLPKKRGAGGGGGEPPTKLCPICQTYNPISRTTCEECGYTFPPPERVKDRASDKPLVAAQTEPTPRPEKQYDNVAVTSMVCTQNVGKGDKPDTVRVDYFTPTRRIPVWLGFNHPRGSFPRRKAEDWWRAHSPGTRVPGDVYDALSRADELRKPSFIKIWVNTKYPEVVDFDFFTPAPEPENRHYSANYAYDDDIPF